MGSRTARKRVVVWGNSHADHFASMVAKASEPHGLAVLSRTMGGCPPLSDVTIGERWHRDNCAQFNIEVLAEIEEALGREELAAVILSARWSVYLGKKQIAEDASDRIVGRIGQANSTEAAPVALAHGLSATLRHLTKKGIKVLVIAPVPEHRYDIPPCLARKSVEFCSIGRGENRIHRDLAVGTLMKAVTETAGARIWDPFSVFCREERCLVGMMVSSSIATTAT